MISTHPLRHCEKQKEQSMNILDWSGRKSETKYDDTYDE